MGETVMREPNSLALEAEFLEGDIVDEFLPKAAAGPGEGQIVNIWSTPVCRWITRHLCTGIFCPNPGSTRDPTICPTREP